MKVYRNNNESPKKLNKKGILTMGITAALIMAAVAVTLVLTLGGGDKIDPIDTPPVNTIPAFVMPVDNVELGMTFSKDKLVKHKTSGFWQTHEGVDFLLESGATVKAISNGTVLKVDLNTIMEGTVIQIQHSDGVVSTYKGLNTTTLTVGATVKAGDTLGAIGTINIESREYEKAHLHLEVTKNGARVDPAVYLTELGDK